MTNNHISDDLPLLLTGDATRDVVIEAAAHLRSCVDCQQELISAVVAHASLTSAHRFAPEIVSPGQDDDETDDRPLPTTLPDLSGVFAEAHAEATVTPIGRMRARRGLIGIAAAAAVIVGGGVTATVVANSSSSTSMSRTVGLAAFDTGSQPASAQIVGQSELKINASKLPKLDATHQYEVWLTNDDRTRMQPIGFINNDKSAALTIPAKVKLSSYNAIEVSVQRADQATYSGKSVLRGSYG